MSVVLKDWMVSCDYYIYSDLVFGVPWSLCFLCYPFHIALSPSVQNNFVIIECQFFDTVMKHFSVHEMRCYSLGLGQLYSHYAFICIMMHWYEAWTDFFHTHDPCSQILLSVFTPSFCFHFLFHISFLFLVSPQSIQSHLHHFFLKINFIPSYLFIFPQFILSFWLPFPLSSSLVHCLLPKISKYS